MRSALRVLSVGVVGVAVVACSSSSGDVTSRGPDAGTTTKHDAGSETGEGGSGGMSVTTFCDALVMADATLFAKCLGGTVAAWEAALHAATSCSELATAVQAGRVTYEASEASACLTASAAITCDASASGAADPAACSATITGTVSPSDTCYSALDCAGQNFCSGLGGATGSCTGTCTPLIAAGQPCTTADRCVTGYSCSGTGTSLTCTAVVAASGASLGSACGFDSTTMKITDCASGLACDAKTLVCVTPVATGAACTPGAGECAPFTDCDPTTKTCKAYPGVGGGCGAAAGQDLVDCTAGAYCKPSSSGAAVGTCAALGGTGAACSSGPQCASGACSKADGGGGTCFAACTEE